MVKNKHKFLILLVCIVFFVCVIVFLLIRSSINTKTFDDFIGKDTVISKVTMFSGSSGESVSTTDKIKIKELVTILNNTHYRKSSNQQGLVGFSYSYTFYVGNKPVLGMSDSGLGVSVYGTRYDTTIEIKDGIKSWYNSLPLQSSKDN
ncbi:MAG: hypothetical protein ACI8WT_000861 [Clostridium sp.]|jgi:hypothetical protein